MTRPIDDNEENADQRRKRGDSGEGDSDSFGRGKAGAGAGGGIRLSAQKMKQVMADWRELKGQELVSAFVEFFAEGPMRAAANASVDFVKGAVTKTFAVVSWALEAGDKAVREFTKDRDRAAGARAPKTQQQKKPRNNFGLNSGPTGPTSL